MRGTCVCTRRSTTRSHNRWRRRTGSISAPSSSADELEPRLWLIAGTAVPLHKEPSSASLALCKPLERGEVVEAILIDDEWARLVPSEAARILYGDSEADAEVNAFLHVRGVPEEVTLFGGRVSGSDELWFARPCLESVFREQPMPVMPKGPVSSLKRLTTMEGKKVESLPPLRHFEQSVTDETISTLIEHGYAIVDNALPAALCRKLKAEMQSLEDNNQMWNSHSYGADEQGSPHKHINETQLDFKEVRKYAPTFARMEHDPSLIDRLRGVPGLERLASQHVRIQINAGHGGCYTMHTDSGTAADKAGQTLCLTALIYLNDGWQEGDGGELRVFPFPYKAEIIPPVQGRLVLFEPRMVHDVLPNYRKRYCFTLWCSQRGIAESRQIDHHSLQKVELSTSLSEGVSHAEAWRQRSKFALPYKPAALTCTHMRAIFLSEMRMALVRIVHASDEIKQIAQSHAGTAHNLEEMLEGISAMHTRIRMDNPRWLLDLLRQLPEAVEDAGCSGISNDVVRLGELRELAHRGSPWWV